MLSSKLGQNLTSLTSGLTSGGMGLSPFKADGTPYSEAELKNRSIGTGLNTAFNGMLGLSNINNSELNSTQKTMARADQFVDTASNVASMFGPVGSAVGLGLGIVNNVGGALMKTPKAIKDFSVSDQLATSTGFGGVADAANEASQSANSYSKSGLFGKLFGKKKAINQVNGSNVTQTLANNILTTNNLAKDSAIASADMFNNKNVMKNYNSNYFTNGSIQYGQQGLKFKTPVTTQDNTQVKLSVKPDNLVEKENLGYITQRKDFKGNFISNIGMLGESRAIKNATAPEMYDLYRYYYGLPTEYNSLKKSQFKPTKSNDPNSEYISVDNDKFKDDVITIFNTQKAGNVNGYTKIGEKGNRKRREGNMAANAIGRFKVDQGKDDNGEYVSYYDVFDSNYGKSMNFPDQVLGASKPFEIYDRIYVDKDKSGNYVRKNEKGGKLSDLASVAKSINVKKIANKTTFAQTGAVLKKPTIESIVAKPAVRTIQPIDNSQMEFWNGFVDYIDQKGYRGNTELDNRDKGLSKTLFNDYAKTKNFTQSYDEFIPTVQTALQQKRKDLIQTARAGKANINGMVEYFGTEKPLDIGDEELEKRFMPGMSQIDGWAGSRTTTYKFPMVKQPQFKGRAPGQTLKEQTTPVIFKDGGVMNVIVDGKLHAHKHSLKDNVEHLADANITLKGVPVVQYDAEGGVIQTSEVEEGEVILHYDLTKKLEELRDLGTDEAMIEAGKLLSYELVKNTKDNVNKLLKKD